jgi:hypothetical protein
MPFNLSLLFTMFYEGYSAKAARQAKYHGVGEGPVES